MQFIYSDPTKKRLDSYLTKQLEDISRSQIQRAIKTGLVMVNGEKPSVHHWLKNGDTIIYAPEEKETVIDRSLTPTIVYEDENYLVIDKPSGLLVHPTERQEPHTVISWLIQHYPQVAKFGDPRRPGLVHRLDRDVSGLIAIALTADSYEDLKRQFQDRSIDKHYIALVHGSIVNNDGIIDTPLERDKKTGKTIAQSALLSQERAHEAITHYEVTKRFLHYTLLDVKLVTGRTHQIRAHLNSIGHSIVGDHLYATRDVRKKKPTELSRPFLHAASLSFQSLTGEAIKCQSELPPELTQFLTKIK